MEHFDQIVEKSTLQLSWDKSRATLRIEGALTVHDAAEALQQYKKLGIGKKAPTTIDLTKVTSLDTVGAMLIKDWRGEETEILCATDSQQSTLEMVAGLKTAPVKHPPVPRGIHAQIIALGKWASFVGQEARELVTFTGKSWVLLWRALLHPKRLRIPEIVHHIEQIGINAMPIIGLISFLIAIVLAYQSVAQLRPYGGEQFTVDLIALSILREMGVLLTAIMVAGRSGSAFTAEIGVMKVREEVDALQVMGFDPFDMLVIPRLIAITIALPLLNFFADMMGLVGGYIISSSLIDITLDRYLERVHYAVGGADFLAGMLKAPVFAFFIGLVGCMHGMRVGGSAESVGRETTASVVKSIFLVLVLDAFFSIFFQKVGI